MSDRFIRSRALFGDEAFEKLKNSRVAVFGLGGVGGYALEALARSGIGALDVIDPDYIDESNINRQLLALSSSVGQKKTQTAVKRLKEINPELIVSAHELELALRSRDAGVKLVSCMGTGKKTAPSLIRVSDISETSVCPLARKMRAELKKRGVNELTVIWSPEQPARDSVQSSDGKKFIPSGAVVPAVAGLYLADAIIKYLLSR